MARNTRQDLERRFITYVNPDGREHDTEGRIVSWLRTNISQRTFDFGLGTAGAGAAMASIIFAGVMMSSDTSHPTFGGSEYLLLFTRPLEHVGAAAGQQPIARNHDAGIDYTATGSIGLVARSNTPDANAALPQAAKGSGVPSKILFPIKDYILTSVSGGVAAIKGPQGVFIAETGSLLPNGDIIVSIDRRGGHWVVVTSSGLIQSQ